MKLVAKRVNPFNSFWVEDYNEKAKEFFLNLGFVEKQISGFKPTFILTFEGSKIFGIWDEKQIKTIMDSLNELNPEYVQLHYKLEVLLNMCYLNLLAL